MADISENKVEAETGESDNIMENAAEQSETIKIKENSPKRDQINYEEEDEELEEGELKDDDDDDDDDIDEHTNIDIVDGTTRASKVNSEESDAENRKRGSSSDSDKSNGKESSKSSVMSSRKSGGNRTRRSKVEAPSTRSSSSSIDRVHKPLSFNSRPGSTSGHNSRSHSRSKRRLSPISDQARLVSMRAQLLEAKSREIEMKFQKNKVHITHSSPLSTLSSSLLAKNLKTTLAKPHITYAENPNPIECNEEPKKKVKSSRVRESKDRMRSSKKSSKKRKRKKSSSSSKKKKKAKISETRNIDNTEKINTSSTHITENAVDRVGPKTPPDNQVLTLDDEQVEWPSYLIKMTTTQPSISYSVNPDSVADNNTTNRPETSDLNADYQWYLDYFTSFEMDKVQAQNQAYSILISTSNYDKDLVDSWLERQGFSKQSDMQNNSGSMKDKDANIVGKVEGPIPLRSTQPSATTLKSNREIVLPNGKILPKGTLQKIVHPYPKTERVTPDIIYGNFDLY